MLAKRLSLLSCNCNELSKAIPDYVEAMRRSGHPGELEYENDHNRKPRKARKQNIVWFNPLFSENVKTNIGREFLRLLAKHFPPHHRLHKVCNKNNIKVSYSCMPNMAAIISRHNKKLLSNRAESACITPPCNCRNKNQLPFERQLPRKLYHIQSHLKIWRRGKALLWLL